tara:strand:- start:23276 stop:23893 length:618 start_codon:yes stop_codon:yes gene_type:complete
VGAQKDDRGNDLSRLEPTGGGAILGVLGLLLAFIAGLVSLVVVLEYDPEASHYKENGLAVHGTVQSSKTRTVKDPYPWQPAIEATVTVRYTLDDQDRLATSRPVHGAQIEYLKPGTETYGYIMPENPDRILIRYAMPHAPRDMYDFIFPGVFWLLGALCLVFGPELLYLGTTGAPAADLPADLPAGKEPSKTGSRPEDQPGERTE